MWTLTSIKTLARAICQLEKVGVHSYNTLARSTIPREKIIRRMTPVEDQLDDRRQCKSSTEDGDGIKRQKTIGANVSRRDKINILVRTLLDVRDSKEAIYGALDAWVAWEREFPIGPLKVVLSSLEKEQQWHRVIQVIKWMLSKGQGNTMGTYGQLIQALDKDHRAKEAHEFWKKKVGSDFHSVPWKLCSIMISVYYRNHMLEELVKLFNGLEAFNRKPQDKSIVQKVADAHEMLGSHEEKERILENYKDLFSQTWKGHPKRSSAPGSPKKERSRKKS